jgi:hypothetical protein
MPAKLESLTLPPLPDEGDPGYFRALVRNCIMAYEKLPNDRIAMDYCKVTGKLRAMVMDDETYIKETRNIYARQRLEEFEEFEYLKAAASGEEEGDANRDPRGRGAEGRRTAIDRDMLNIRFRAAQHKREILADINRETGDVEKDAVNIFFVAMSREEFTRLEAVEAYQGSGDIGLDDLITQKEEIPAGSMRLRGQTRTGDGVFEVVNDDGSVEEL